MQMKVTFPGGMRVNAEYGAHTIHTDQPEQYGGDGSAPAPLDLFLASLATCTGFYVLRFCQTRNLQTDGLEVIQSWEHDRQTHTIPTINIEIKLPPSVPEKYHDAIKNSANLCAVKKYLANPPTIHIGILPVG